MSIDDFNNMPLGYAAASLNHAVAVLFRRIRWPSPLQKSWGCAAA